MECNHKYELKVSDTSGFAKKVYTYRCDYCGHAKIVTYSSLFTVISTIKKDTTNYVKSKTMYRRERIYKKAA